jgi:hypothetical protein
MRPEVWRRVLAGAVAAAPCVAFAETYLTEDQAAQALFPGARLAAGWETLTPAEAKSVEKASGERVLDRRLRLWRAPDGACMFVDRVVGKHEFITYAVGLAPDGSVKGVEIMDYRETFGDQVRGEGWRRQFSGKKASDPVRIGKDVKNISGATLSSVHVANGVRRLLQTHEALKRRG